MLIQTVFTHYDARTFRTLQRA